MTIFFLYGHVVNVVLRIKERLFYIFVWLKCTFVSFKVSWLCNFDARYTMVTIKFIGQFLV